MASLRIVPPATRRFSARRACRSRPLHPPPLAGSAVWRCTRVPARRCQSRSRPRCTAAIRQHASSQRSIRPGICGCFDVHVRLAICSATVCLVWCRNRPLTPRPVEVLRLDCAGSITAVPRYGTSRSAVSARANSHSRRHRGPVGVEREPQPARAGSERHLVNRDRAPGLPAARCFGT